MLKSAVSTRIWEELTGNIFNEVATLPSLKKKKKKCPQGSIQTKIHSNSSIVEQHQVLSQPNNRNTVQLVNCKESWTAVESKYILTREKRLSINGM